MPRYSHKAGGSHEIIETKNPIYDWSTGNGGQKPEYATRYLSDKWTAKHPAPKGQRERYDGSTPPKDSESGAHFVGESGKTASPGVKSPPGKLKALNRGLPRGIPDQDGFNRGFGTLGSGELTAKGKGGDAGRDKGVPYIDSKGRRSYMGRSG
jgi:hypothetical protein